MTKLTLTTIALLAGTALASAQGLNAQQQQGGNDTKAAAPAPAAQQKAPAEKIAPKAEMPRAGKAETTGQAPKADTGTKTNMDNKTTTDTKANAGQEMNKSGAAGKEMNKSTDKTDMKANEKSSMDTKTKANEKSSMDTKDKANEKSSMDTKGKANENNKSAAETDKSKTTGQGAAGARGAANLSTEQRTKIRTVIKEKVHVQPVAHVNFSISVGTRVPRDVHFYPVPVEVVEIYPQWRGYELILVGNDILIIEPSTYEIVAVINS